MKSRHLLLLGASVAMSIPTAYAIPNQIGGFLAQAESPLNDSDLTDVLLAAGAWNGELALPGKWRDEAPVAAVRSSYLAARPKVFGLPALMVQAQHRGNKLNSLTITFADAGSYFGYLQDDLPKGLSARERQKVLQKRVADRQNSFAKEFVETEEALRKALGKISKGRPRNNSIGKTRTLRAEVTDYRKDDLLLRLVVGSDRLIRVLVVPEDQASRAWLDSDRASLSKSSLGRVYQDRVTKTENGDVRIDSLPVVPQGYKPYCGLNTLTMAARYFGLHLDEDWLAVAGKFQNTGSAAGSQIPRLYLAVAQEAGLKMHKSNDFSLSEAKSSLDKGFPVIVWRRFSYERNQIHSKQSAQAARDSSYKLPAPDTATRDSYPTKKAPLHASVIVGYNADRQEVLFVESWAGMKLRRMRAEEMTSTNYLTFYFK